MDGEHSLAHCERLYDFKSKDPRLRRPLHQSTLTLGDMTSAPCYTTTHAQSYCGRAADGRPLIFHLPDPCLPSQHLNRLDVGDKATPCLLQSHTREVHGLKHTTPRVNMTLENWARYQSGRDVREITNPRDPTLYSTTYRAEHHRLPDTDGPPHWASGKPTQWHRHNILTGEERQPAGPGKPSRRSGDKQLWAARRWETDCCALRLY
ncbi:uncharacterized protein LOC142992482 [Genypterus blacodes]|uniref:uncharacterized protein LOC142992482 n=1 Tax=Genypterus blacodes TaxID=154954 RepID=UPI003F7683EF